MGLPLFINTICFTLIKSNTFVEISGLELFEMDALKRIINEIATMLKPEVKETMKIQLTPWKEAHQVRMEDLYTRLKIEKHTINPENTRKEEFIDYKELFKDIEENKRLLIKGDPGIGKTTLARKLIFDWANNKRENSDLQEILLAFLITLKYTSSCQSIEQMIKNQHHCLARNEKITQGIIGQILERVGKHCLIILEGYDEIPENFNPHLMDVIKKKIYRDCSILVTSRPNAVEEMEAYMATIASIEGFSKENTKKYIEKVIKDPTKQQATFEYTEHSVIEEMWRYPILVLFLCLLVNWGEINLNEETLPVGEFYTRLLNCLFRRYLAKIQDQDSNDDQESKRENVLLRIGKIAFNGILSNRVAYKKSEILSEIGPDAFAYGILIGSDEYAGNRFLDENADMFVYFAHKSIQEYLAAKYFMHQIGTLNKNITDLLGKRYNLDFIERNLMFLTFCGYFIKKMEDHDRQYSAVEQTVNKDKAGQKSIFSAWFKLKSKTEGNILEQSVRDKIVEFISRCLDKSKVKLEGMTIHEEGLWLFLEALPKCSKISSLHLKNMKINVPINNLLKGLSRSLKSLHIENCNTENVKGKIDHYFVFDFLQEIKFSGTLGCLDVLVSPVFRAVRKLDVDEKHLTWQDINSLYRARTPIDYLPNLDYPRYAIQESEKHMPVLPMLFGMWRSVEGLYLTKCEFSNNDVMTLAGANMHGMLPSITEISLCNRDRATNATGNKKISGHLSVLMCAKWLKLNKLSLPECYLTADDIRALGVANSNGYLPRLRELHLSNNANASGQLAVLLSSPWALLVLNVRSCSLVSSDMKALSDARRKGYLPLLVSLKMEGNNISGPISVLLSTQWILQHLGLEACKLTADDMWNLSEANSKGLPCLRVLWLDSNKISGSGLCNLLSHRWPELLMLSMKSCSLLSEDGMVLLQAYQKGCLPKLRMLELGTTHNIQKDVLGQLQKVIEGVSQGVIDKFLDGTCQRLRALQCEVMQPILVVSTD